MQTNTLAVPARSRWLPFGRLHRCSRSVAVRVLVEGREVDSLQASTRDGLRDSLRPIYRHLPGERGMVEFTGIENRWLPAGIGHTHREVVLEDLNAALEFLTN